MAIFTAIATFLLAGTFLAGTIAVPLLAAGLGIAASIGLSYAAKALAGSPAATATVSHFGTQGALNSGGDVPRSFNLGYSVTAGSLVYANYHGGSTATPNAYLTQVIALADLPGGTLVEVWVNGEKVTLTGADGAMGRPVTEYFKGGADHLWIKYYDGSQTIADPYLVSTVSSADRPYASTRVGTGVAYVICTSLVEDTLWTGFPTFKFALSGVPLYDISKDDTAGGSGAHRYSDKSTWGGDGDSLPAVQIYNVLRGFYYGSSWLYGLQNTSAARLPAANWIAQIAKCRATITGLSGLEPTYRCGGQVNISAPSASAIETMLTACQGRISEIGGFFKIHLGPPDSPSFSFTDDDIISTEGQVFKPFFALADSVNGIQGTYPDPAQGWNTATAPAYYRTDLEVKDGNRRLMASPAFDFVPYPEQVQRLQKSAVQEAQRARTHTIVLPPAFWLTEPGDVGSWTSARNGYVNKQFRIDASVDKANLDITTNITEVDPTDYNFVHASDFTSLTIGTTVFPRPAPQGIVAWNAIGAILYDADGIGRRPALKLMWDGTLPGVVGVQYEVRNAGDLLVIGRGRTDQLAAGSLLISQSLIPNTAYQVRGQYLPSAPRDMLWSDWLSATTPDIKLSLIEFDTALKAQVTIITDALNDKIDSVLQQIAAIGANDIATNWLDKKSVRSEVYAQAGNASASVTTLTTAVAQLNGFAAAEYSVTLDVNGYASGFNLFNGGAGISQAVFLVDKFQIASPGVGGGSPVPIFTVGNVGGSPKIGIRGDMFVDGTITGAMIHVGTVQAINIAAGTITSASGVIGSLGVQTLSIADNAVIVPLSQTLSTALAPTTFTSIASLSMVVDTTGLAGKPVTIIVGFYCGIAFSGTYNYRFRLVVDGVTLQDYQGLNSAVGFIDITSAYTFTASGGVQTIPITLDYYTDTVVANRGTTGPRTLWAMTAKR